MKIIDWVKKHKGVIIGTASCAVLGACGYYFYKQLTTEGTKLWISCSSLEQLEKYREQVATEYRFSGINNLSEEDYIKVETTLHKIDFTIEKIKWNGSIGNLPTREHGWYLPSND